MSNAFPSWVKVNKNVLRKICKQKVKFENNLETRIVFNWRSSEISLGTKDEMTQKFSI